MSFITKSNTVPTQTGNTPPKFKIDEFVYHTQPGGDENGKTRTLYCLRKAKEIKRGFVNSYKMQHGTLFISENVLVSRAVGDRLAKEDPVYHKIMME